MEETTWNLYMDLPLFCSVLLSLQNTLETWEQLEISYSGKIACNFEQIHTALSISKELYTNTIWRMQLLLKKGTASIHNSSELQKAGCAQESFHCFLLQLNGTYQKIKYKIHWHFLQIHVIFTRPNISNYVNLNSFTTITQWLSIPCKWRMNVCSLIYKPFCRIMFLSCYDVTSAAAFWSWRNSCKCNLRSWSSNHEGCFMGLLHTALFTVHTVFYINHGKHTQHSVCTFSYYTTPYAVHSLTVSGNEWAV